MPLGSRLHQGHGSGAEQTTLKYNTHTVAGGTILVNQDRKGGERDNRR